MATTQKEPKPGSAAQVRASHRDWLDEQPVFTQCVCGWTYEGKAAESRVAAREHRRDAHGMTDDARELLLKAKRRKQAEKQPVRPAVLPPPLDGAAAAGGDAVPSNGRRKWARDEARAALLALAEDVGHPPSLRDVKDAAGRGLLVPSEPTLKKLFGSWPAAVEAAGFPRPGKGTRYAPARAAPAPPSSPPTPDPDSLAAEPAERLRTPPTRLARDVAIRDALIGLLDAALDLIDAVYPAA